MPSQAMPGARSSFCAFIFDMDGVLVDNSRYYGLAWERFLAAHPDVRYPDYPADRTFGRRNSDLLPEVFGVELDPVQLGRLAHELESYYLELYEPVIAPTPGLLPFIHHLRSRGARLALATSAPLVNVEMVLRRLQLQTTFDVVLSEADVTLGKPDPQIFQTAATRLQCDPLNCLVFEDALAGVAAARSAGMRCIALSTTYPEAALFAAGADLVIHDFRDERLSAFLERTEDERASSVSI